jgi:pimeloyl-ACP methyl ester carboxylesterase
MRRVAPLVGRAIAGALLLLLALLAWQWKSDLPLDELKARWGSGASRFVDVDGMSVHYRDEGAGPPLLLIHGTGASLHTWDAWSAALSGTHRVVRLDLPGFGLTGPQPDGDYRIDTYVDMVDHFATRVGLDRFALAGNSLGGQIAWRFAVRHPEAVNALILVDAAGYPRSVKPPLVFRLGRVPVVSSLMGHLDPHMLVESTLKKTYGDPTRVTPDLVERYYELALRPGNRAAFGARTALPFEDRTAELRDLNVPTLILWGAKDALIPVSDAQRFAGDIRGATLRVYDDLGHVPMEEDGEHTAADAKAFLERRL